MSIALSSAAQRFEAAREAYAAGRPADAVRLLDPVLQSDPRAAPAQHLMGLCLIALGAFEGAERALRAAIAADKRRADVHAVLAELLASTGRPGEAEKAYRAALSLDRRHLGAAAGLARLLIEHRRAPEALQTTTPLVAAADARPEALDAHASALRELGRFEEALEIARRAVAAGSPFAEVQVASILRELGRYEEAEAAARRGVAAVGEHPSAMTMLGRALQDLGRYDEADAAYRQGLTRAPLDPGLHQSLAELLWKRTADPDKAATPLDSVLRQRPTPPLLALRAKLYNRAERPDLGFALLTEALRHAPDDALLHAAAATSAAFAGEVEPALVHAERAHALAPGSTSIQVLAAETALAAGRPERAAELVAPLRERTPHDQQLIALQAVAWRLMGEARYRDLYDYDAMVQAFTLPTPEGWDSLETFLADLAVSAKALHRARGEQLDQSVRGGVQTEQNLALSSDPVLRAFFKAVEGPVAEYLKRLGRGRDPFRARNAGRHRVKAAWSVKLEPEGFHANHLHPEGWISSAFYIELPRVMAGGGEAHAGWIKFGEPGVPTRPALEAEHFVRPEPGRLVLFPSYMWHGTVPFSGDEPRLTMAFDIVPA